MQRLDLDLGNDAYPILIGADLLAQRRLLDRQAGCSRGHLARVGDGQEVAQVAKVHREGSAHARGCHTPNVWKVRVQYI